MSKPTLHLLGLPHTVTRAEWSHCAFTGKVLRFSPMLRSVGYDVIHYGVEGATSGATEQVDVISRKQLENFIGKHDPSSPKFYGEHTNVASPLYKMFNQRLKALLQERTKKGDIICLPFGHGHEEAVRHLSNGAYLLESGIGYDISFANNRVYETYAWMHHQAGKENRRGHDYHWVIPNYYDLSEWSFEPAHGKYLLFFGRLGELKGSEIVFEVAKNLPDVQVVVCGQGDAGKLLKLPNVEYRAPIWGLARAALYAGAFATICPTRYVEPFGGVTVESMLCGTPVLGSSYGSFTETIDHGVSGFRCRTLGDWLCGVRLTQMFGPNERARVRAWAEKYDMLKLAHEYDKVCKQIVDLEQAGWYSPRCTWV